MTRTRGLAVYAALSVAFTAWACATVHTLKAVPFVLLLWAVLSLPFSLALLWLQLEEDEQRGAPMNRSDLSQRRRKMT